MSKFNIEKQTINHHFLSQFFFSVLEENVNLKNRLERNDNYQEFAFKKTRELLNRSLLLREKNKVSIIEALEIIQEKFKIEIANE